MKIGLLNKQTEIVDNSTIKHLYFSILELNYSPAHTHKDIEIIQILDGSLHVTTLGEEFDLSAGDVAVINSEEIHTVHSNGITPCRLLLIQINPKMFRSYYPQIEHIRFLSNNIGTQLTDDVLEKFKALFFHIGYHFFSRQPAFELICMSDVNKLMSYMIVNLPYKVIDDSEYVSDAIFEKRIKRVIEYINNHYQERITLSQIAQNENLSLTYLSHFFKDRLRISFQDYVNELRFDHAMYLLVKTNYKIVDICMESGFSDPKYFNNMFQRLYKMTPTQYRRQIGITSSSSRHGSNACSTDSGDDTNTYTSEQALQILRESRYYYS